MAKRKPLFGRKKAIIAFEPGAGKTRMVEPDIAIEFRRIPYGYEARIGQQDWRTVIETDSGFILKSKQFEQPESGGGVSGCAMFSPLVQNPLTNLRLELDVAKKDLAQEEYYSKKLEKLLIQVIGMSHD